MPPPDCRRSPKAIKKTKPPPRQFHDVDRTALLAAWGEMHAAAELFYCAIGVVLKVVGDDRHPDAAWVDQDQMKAAHAAAAELRGHTSSSPIRTHDRAGCLLLPVPRPVAGGTQ